MSERDVDARVEELTRELRRLAAGLLEAAAGHPDAGRARELSSAARVLTGEVLARLERETTAGEADAAGSREPEVRDAVPPEKAMASGSWAAAKLVDLYLEDYERSLPDPVMCRPGLRYKQWIHLERLRDKRGAPFAKAPLWTDEVPGRGRRVVRGLTSRAEVLRRLHRTYVTRRDLDTPEGELALGILHVCRAITRSRAHQEGGLGADGKLSSRLESERWRAVTTAAGRGERARDELALQLARLEVLAAAVLKLDVVVRRRALDPAAGERIASAARAVGDVLSAWPPAVDAVVTESGHTIP